MSNPNEEETTTNEDADPSVPTELLDLFVQLDELGVPSEKMEDAFK